jgi:hypothetical protein
MAHVEMEASLATLSVPAAAYNVCDDVARRHGAYADAVAAALGVASPRLPPPWMTRPLESVGEMLARSQRISNRPLKAAARWAPRDGHRVMGTG